MIFENFNERTHKNNVSEEVNFFLGLHINVTLTII